MEPAVTHVAACHDLVVASLRAITEAGESYDDPSEDLLFMLLHDIETGAGTFLIVERTSDPTGQTYVQTQRQPDRSYVVERREGDAQHHFGTTAPNMRAAHHLLTGWAYQLDGSKDTATWEPLTF